MMTGKKTFIPPVDSHLDGIGGNQLDGTVPADKAEVKPVGGQMTVTAPQQGQVEGKKTLSYLDMIGEPPAQTQEDLEREHKRRKRQALFSAIGDGISALSNLFFTTKGAPSMLGASPSLTEKSKERWAKLDKERAERREAYRRAYMQARALEQEDEARNHAMEREKIEDERWQKTFDEAKRKNDMAKEQNEAKKAVYEAEAKRYEALQKKDEAGAAYYKEKADALKKGIPLELAVKRAEIAKKQAEARLASARRTKVLSSGSKGGKTGNDDEWENVTDEVSIKPNEYNGFTTSMKSTTRRKQKVKKKTGVSWKTPK